VLKVEGWKVVDQHVSKQEPHLRPIKGVYRAGPADICSEFDNTQQVLVHTTRSEVFHARLDKPAIVARIYLVDRRVKQGHKENFGYCL
jgi:hypothetical protein